MTATIQSLWPDDIKVEVLRPLAILRIQAAKVQEITSGILRGEVSTVTGPDDFVSHRLELIAPQLGNRRYGVLSVTHRTDLYPVVLEAECFKPKNPVLTAVGMAPNVMRSWPSHSDWRPVAPDQDEFLKLVGEVLKSSEVRSAISSMLALSNEKTNDAGPTDTAA